MTIANEPEAPQAQEATNHEILDVLHKISRRLPDPDGEYPLDRHLREIRNELRDLKESLSEIFWKRRSEGRDGVVPGLNRAEDRIALMIRFLWALTITILSQVAALSFLLIQRALGFHS